MDETAGVLVRGSMWLATVAWALGEACAGRSPGLDRGARAAWTAGVVLALVHAALAFHFVYGWSHRVAAVATEEQAAAVFGIGWSGGILVNYVFLVIWVLDAAWWWLAPHLRTTHGGWAAARFAFFVFMFVNGAVVFATGTGRLVGVVCVIAALGGRARAGRQAYAST